MLPTLGVRGHVRLFAGHSHNPVKESLLCGDDEGLGQSTAGGGTCDRLLVVACDDDDALGTRHLHLEVGVVRYRHELGQSRPA